MALPSDKNGEQFTGSRIFCSTKTRLIKYHQRFCEKLEAVLRIIEDLKKKHRWRGPILLNFFSLLLQCEIDV